MSPEVLWFLSIALIVAGLAGTVLPLLPGTALVLAGIVLGAWIDDFTRVGWGTLAVVGTLAVASWALEYVAGVLGAKRAGASGLALAGAAIGTVVGVFMGFVGVLFMPLVGAAAGEWFARRRAPHAAPQAMRVGVATWLGIVAGLVAKVVLACGMVGVFVVALWW